MKDYAAGLVSHFATKNPLEWRPPRTQLLTPAQGTEVVDIENERPVFDWVSQVSRHVGTLVHRELDRLCRPGGQASQ